MKEGVLKRILCLTMTKLNSNLKELLSDVLTSVKMKPPQIWRIQEKR